MRVLNLATSDYANMSHNNARALRSIGVRCEDYTTMPHKFRYKTESKVNKFLNIPFDQYDVIQIFHSDLWILAKIPDTFKGKLIVYHTGTRYRQDPDRYNGFFNHRVHRCITDQTEFMNLGGKGIEYLAPHIELHKEPKQRSGKLIIGHYPSNPDQKGTHDIIEMCRPYHAYFDIRISEQRVSHDQQIKRMAECHVYLELFNQYQDGKEYGCYGVTAFEAAALGCFVVTQNLYPEVYEDTYGYPPFYYANSKEAFTAMLEDLKYIDRENLVTPDSFYIRHNIESTGYRILKLITK